MKLRAALAFVLALILCQCCPEPGSTAAKIGDAANAAGYQVSKGVLGPFLAGPPPKSYDGTKCPPPSPWAPDPDEEPAIGTASVSARVDACAKSHADDSPCAICAKASCCAESFACVAVETCSCLLARKLGIAWPAEVPCGEDDGTYAVEAACLDAHCAEECYP